MIEPLEPHIRAKFNYDPETGIISAWRTVMGERKLVPTGSISDGYVRVWVFGRYMHGHRLAFFLMEGRWPTAVDHINGIKSDNRWENLREASSSDNMRNIGLRVDNRSGKTGVHFASREQKWCARIRMHPGRGGLKHLGYYDNIDDAVAAVKKFEIDNKIVRRS